MLKIMFTKEKDLKITNTLSRSYPTDKGSISLTSIEKEFTEIDWKA